MAELRKPFPLLCLKDCFLPGENWHKIYISGVPGRDKGIKRLKSYFFIKLLRMEKTNKILSITQQIEALNEQYETALKSGEEFSTLKDIRDQLKLLQLQLVSINSNENDDGLK